MSRYTWAGARRRARRYRVRLGQWIAGARGLRAERFPAGFENWLERYNPRQPAYYPDAWRATPEMLATPQPCPLAVVMHVHFPDLVDELVEHLRAIPVPFDLIVTDSSGTGATVDTSRLPNARSVKILAVPNHGRDIGPLAWVVNAGLLDDAEIVLKVHTKRSPWRESHTEFSGSGEAWRTGFLDELLGSPENVESILSAFAEHRTLGAVTSSGNLLGPEFWGGDEAIARALLRRLELRSNSSGLRFPAGSMYWIRGFVLQGLRSLALTREDFEVEAGQIDGTTAHAVERLIGILTEEAGFDLAERPSLPHVSSGAWKRFESGAGPQPLCRVVPFYLPQFHAFELNDRWWGRGFTEWTNVAAARPAFRGHRQPLIPGELGFYDLARDEVRSRQTELAAEHGIAGFMYYYYWFAGRRVMNDPIEAHVASEDSFPFCIMWANENWTRRWDGRDDDVIVAQHYDEVPATEFIDDVLPLLKDPRYLRIHGRAVLAVYRIAQIDGYEAVVESWRERARSEGVGELHLLGVDVGEVFDGVDRTTTDGVLDGHLAFPPHNHHWEWLPWEDLGVDERFKGHVLGYHAMAENAIASAERMAAEAGYYPGAMVTFDNTARRQWTADLWWGSNPYTFRRWIAALAAALQDRPESDRVIFLNAWNEWAESAVLEPTTRFGRTYLQALRSAISR